MTSPRVPLIVAMLVACGLAAGGNEERPPAKPACRQCGSPVHLQAICVCEPGSSKKSRTVYDVTCESICLPGPAGPPWKRDRSAGNGCTECGPTSCDCPGRVRHRKALQKKTVEEDVCVVDRRVEYVCAACLDAGEEGCGGPKPRVCTGSKRSRWLEAIGWPW